MRPLSNFLAGDQVVTQVKSQGGRTNGTRMMSALTYIVLIVFAIFGIQYWLKNKRYTFEAEDVAKIVKRHVGKGKYFIVLHVQKNNAPQAMFEFLQHSSRADFSMWPLDRTKKTRTCISYHRRTVAN